MESSEPVEDIIIIEEEEQKAGIEDPAQVVTESSLTQL